MWKESKNTGLPSKAALTSKICLKENYFTQFDDKTKCKHF